MKDMKPKIRLWLIGLALFAVVVALSFSLVWSGAEFGISDHQRAGTAELVDEIQSEWRAAGVRWLAIVAMVADLVFIGVYGWGSFRAGRSFARMGRTALSILGVAVMAAAVVFAVTDYVETILQLVQLLRDAGSDRLAGIAASVGPAKELAWLATVFGIVACLAIRHIHTRLA